VFSLQVRPRHTRELTSRLSCKPHLPVYPNDPRSLFGHVARGPFFLCLKAFLSSFLACVRASLPAEAWMTRLGPLRVRFATKDKVPPRECLPCRLKSLRPRQSRFPGRTTFIFFPDSSYVRALSRVRYPRPPVFSTRTLQRRTVCHRNHQGTQPPVSSFAPPIRSLRPSPFCKLRLFTTSKQGTPRASPSSRPFVPDPPVILT